MVYRQSHSYAPDANVITAISMQLQLDIENEEWGFNFRLALLTPEESITGDYIRALDRYIFNLAQ